MADIRTDDRLKVINDDFLPGNDVKPPIKIGEEYICLGTYSCECGESHINIGLKSDYNYITCYKCQEELPQGDVVHWCHNSRFEVIPN